MVITEDEPGVNGKPEVIAAPHRRRRTLLSEMTSRLH